MNKVKIYEMWDFVDDSKQRSLVFSVNEIMVRYWCMKKGKPFNENWSPKEALLEWAINSNSEIIYKEIRTNPDLIFKLSEENFDGIYLF